MEVLGNCGRSGRDYTGAEGVLAGRLASQYEPKVRPDDRCPKCEALGKLESEHCFTRHWNGGRANDGTRAHHGTGEVAG